MNLALMNLTRRAEGTDRGSLVATFVNVGSLASVFRAGASSVVFLGPAGLSGVSGRVQA